MQNNFYDMINSVPYKCYLQEMDLIEQNLIEELQKAKASVDSSHLGESKGMLDESKQIVEAQEAANSALMEKLNSKKRDLVCCMVKYNICILCLFHLHRSLILVTFCRLI